MNRHSRPLTERIRDELMLSHMGQAEGIACKALAAEVSASQREVRKAITELREHGQPICGTPARGYYMAQTAEELDETCRFLRGRAMCSLRLESQLRRVPLSYLMGQLQLELGEPTRAISTPKE